VRIIWSEAMERALLEALVHEVSEGRQADTGFKGVSWEAARVKVAALAPHQEIGKHHCKSKHDNIKKDWKV
jgi:hypothetical protein